MVRIQTFEVNPESIRTWVLSFGWVAPVIYIGMYIACSKEDRGRLFLGKKNHPRLVKLERAMERKGFTMVLMLRIAPFVPFDLVSYAAGVARVPLRAFLPATIIGTLLGTLLTITSAPA